MTLASLPRGRTGRLDVGTYSLGVAPDETENDVPAAWCTNPTPEGTPGEANPPCP